MKTIKCEIATPDGNCDVFLSYPNENGEFPAIVFLPDIFGLRGSIQEMTEHLASFGYCVLAPNFFYRDKKAPLVDEKLFPLTRDTFKPIIDQLMPLRKTYSDEKAMTDIGAILSFLKTLRQVKPGKMGLVGYCMGGYFGLRAAERYASEFAAFGSFHASRLASNASDSPHLDVKKIKAECYFGHADQDEGMPQEQIERLEQALRSVGVRFESELYKGAGHGFTMKDVPAYKEWALNKHWTKIKELFGRNL